MTTTTQSSTAGGMPRNAKRGIAAGVIVVLLVAMGLSTTYVKDGEQVGPQTQQFSADAYGKKEFPKIRKAIEGRAATADTLATALNKDKSAAVKQYGVQGTIGPVMSVKFSGTVQKCDHGICTVSVPGLPSDQTVRVQVGPAINGTALRDGIGTISFGQFENQIQYQDAGSGINNAMKKAVLSNIDRDKLTGKKINVTGAFQLIVPNNWLVTPVALSVSS